MSGLYSIGTWDAELEAYTPEDGVPAFNLTLCELGKSIRILRMIGYSAHRVDELHNDFNVLVERTDGMPQSEILKSWLRCLRSPPPTSEVVIHRDPDKCEYREYQKYQ